MPAPSLLDSCAKACIRNVRSLTDVGVFEYTTIRSILQRIENPEQLRQIELRSPQIQGEDAELWRAFIARDIPNWATKNYVPKNSKNWYAVYKKYRKEQQRDIERDEAILRESMMGLKKERETNVSKVVDLRTERLKVPRDPRMMANNGGVPLGKRGFKETGRSSLVFSGGSKTKLTDGRSVLTKARREAKEISHMNKIARPTHLLTSRMGQIRKAPVAMVQDYQNAAKPAMRIYSRKATIGKLPTSVPGISGSSLEERERRLRALTSGGAGVKRDASGAVKETVVGSSDEEEEDDEDIYDLFDERPAASSRPQSHATSSSPPPARSSRPASRPIASSPAASARPPQASSRPVSEAQPSTASISKPRPHPSSASPPSTSTPPAPKPSDMISSIISRQKQAPFTRTGSPAPGSKPMMPRKKPEVDIFNRGAKKPRLR